MAPVAALLLLLLAAGARAALPLPEYVRPCSIKASDKKLGQCGLERAREIMPKVMKGDSKYNIPLLDPLHVDRMEIINGKGPLGMQLIANDVKVYGLPNMVINNVTHVSKPGLVNTYVATIPEIVVQAKYNISGRILLLPITGHGNVDLKLKNLKLIYQFDSKLEKWEDGEIYYVPQSGARLDIEADGLTVHLDNLFNDDKILLETTNKFLNDEWKEVFESLRPSFAKEVSIMITRILNGIFTQVPAKDSFLDFEEYMKSDDRFKLYDKAGGR